MSFVWFFELKRKIPYSAHASTLRRARAFFIPRKQIKISFIEFCFLFVIVLTLMSTPFSSTWLEEKDNKRIAFFKKENKIYVFSFKYGALGYCATSAAIFFMALENINK